MSSNVLVTKLKSFLCCCRNFKQVLEENPVKFNELSQREKLAYILLGAFLGIFGMHNFYIGDNNKALKQLLISILSCGILIPVVFIWAIHDICTVAKGEIKNKLAYTMLGIFFGAFGIHNFYAGYKKKAMTQLLISVLSLSFLSFIVFCWAVYDIYTVKADADAVPFK